MAVQPGPGLHRALTAMENGMVFVIFSSASIFINFNHPTRLHQNFWGNFYFVSMRSKVCRSAGGPRKLKFVTQLLPLGKQFWYRADLADPVLRPSASYGSSTGKTEAAAMLSIG
jgi:hypothetical protein